LKNREVLILPGTSGHLPMAATGGPNTGLEQVKRKQHQENYSMKTAKLASVLMFVSALFLCGMAFAQVVDHGVQTASRGTGLALASVQANDNPGILAAFNDGLNRFQNVEAVSGTPDIGLGPRFNFNSCAGCHAVPAVGGTGPAVNPQFRGVGSCANGVAGLSNDVTHVGAGQPTPQQTGTIACNSTNAIPSFITQNGPTREARFPFFFNANGTPNLNNPNGGVETLFTVSGRPDGGQNCSLQQPSFATAAAGNNLIFRIPTPLFGVGLMENLDDSTLLSNRLRNLNNGFGVAGTFNRNGNDGTITRFGWKAQNKSLHIFSGEAYNVEMGISNLLFQQDRPLPGEDGADGSNSTGLPASCLNLGGNGYPEDSNNPGSTGVAVFDDVSAFANFMRTLAPPPPGGVAGVTAASIANGRSLFSAVGCAVCHNPTPGTTQASNVTGGLANAPVPWRITSRKAQRVETSSARRRCGDWDSGSSCYTMVAPPT
jgi:mono/diheme cytochrome c family protein